MTCKTCAGTGRVWSMRTWFKSDGYNSSRCGMCAGSGKSTAVPDNTYRKFQQRAREEMKQG